MSKNSKDVHGASGKTNCLLFDPQKLVIAPKGHKLYDPRSERPIDEPTVASIMARGVVEPVIVWRDSDAGVTYVVDGRQRVKNAIEANRRLRRAGEPERQVKAIVERVSEKGAMGLMVLANEGRTEPTPMGRARMVERLLEAGYSEEEAAVLLHVSKQTMKSLVALLSCHSSVKSAVESGRVPVSVALKLSKEEPAAQKEAIEKIEKVSGPSRKRAKKVREVAGIVKMRGKSEVEKMLAFMTEHRPEAKGTLALLRWVLGGPDPLAAPSKVEVTNGVQEAVAPS